MLTTEMKVANQKQIYKLTFNKIKMWHSIHNEFVYSA